MRYFKNTGKRIHFFTLMELLVSMAVFSILMLLLMQIFSSSQRVWSSGSQKVAINEEAGIILNVLESDLKTARKKLDRDYQGFLISGDSAPAAVSFLCASTETTGTPGTYDTSELIVKYETKQIDSASLYCLFRETFFSMTNKNEFNEFLDGTGSGDSKTPKQPALTSNAVLLASNIYSLKINPYYGSNYVSFPLDSSTDSKGKYPSVVIIELKLMDEDVVSTYLDPDTPAARKTALENENVHTFNRIITLN